jgi:hypothetical protein
VPKVRGAGVQAPLADVPFIPEIEHEGRYHPVCGIGFADNDEGAKALCRRMGFNYGGTAIRTNAIYAKDAMPIGRCNPGEGVESCSAGGNAYGDFTSQGGACATGNPVGVQIVCNEQVGWNSLTHSLSVDCVCCMS